MEGLRLRSSLHRANSQYLLVTEMSSEVGNSFRRKEMAEPSSLSARAACVAGTGFRRKEGAPALAP